MSQDDLFRKQATDAMHSPDARGGLLTIAPPWSVVVFGTLSLIFAALVLLAVFGRARVFAEGRGVVEPNQPPIVVRAPLDGMIASVSVTPNEHRKRGELLLAFDVRAYAAQRATCISRLSAQKNEYDRLQQRLASWDKTGGHDATLALVMIAQLHQARAQLASTRDACEHLAQVLTKSRVSVPVDATVSSIAVAQGSYVHQGDALATLLPAKARLVGYVTVPEAYRSELAPGRSVRLKFDALPYDSVGAGTGTITRVLDALPPYVTIKGASQALAEVAIDRMPAAASPRHGMTFTADIFAHEERVWSVLFGSSSE